MVEVSKHLFEQVCSDLPCSTLVHPWNKNCWGSTIELFKQSAVGSAKFHSIIYLVQILMRGKKMLKKNEWLKLGQYYVRSTALGLFVTATAPAVSCLFRNLGYKFTTNTYLYIPFSLSGLFIYLEPPGRRGLIINLFCNLLLEYYLLRLKRAGYISIAQSHQTLLFMLGSALLFYLMRLEGDKKSRTPVTWLFTPEKVRRKADDSENVCPHEGVCEKYIGKGFATYFGVGVGITLARVILPQLRTPIKAISSIRGKHLRLGLFFGSYIGIYRAVICYLCRKQGVDSALYSLPAGYAAGLSFMFNPSLGIAIASITAAAKLYSTILYEKKVIPTNLPLPELLYCFCLGTLFSARLLDPDVCPSYVFNVMKTVSNGRAEWISKNFNELIKRAK